MSRETTIDTSVGVGAVSTPAWLDLLHVAAQEFILIGGAFLLLLRIFRVLQKLWRGQKEDDE